MDQCSNVGYSRWVAAGMPKRFNPVAPVVKPHTLTWSEFLMDTAPRVAQAMNPAPTQDNGVTPALGTIRYSDGRVEPMVNWAVDYESMERQPFYPMPDTLFGLPVIWADEAQELNAIHAHPALRTEPTNEQA